MNQETIKTEFLSKLKDFSLSLKEYVSTPDNQWTIKGFIDVFQNIYSISSDSKVISKILEIHLFSKFLEFADRHHFQLILAEKQNWYPDISFVSKTEPSIKFAVDLKTTYRLQDKPDFCNGFTLGSHGTYFTERNSTKNIQFPYNQYLAHCCLGIIYSRNILNLDDETTVYNRYQHQDLIKIQSVISNFEFFACEKWKIASDKSGSGNTANIGSISYIPDILQERGIFSQLGESWFDEYWMNFGKILLPDKTNRKGKPKSITSLEDYLKFKGKSQDWIEQFIPVRRIKNNSASIEDK